MEYAHAGSAARQAGGSRVAGALICLVIGIPFTTIGLAALVTSLRHGWVEMPAVLFA